MVSIIVPSYQHAAFLDKRLESIRDQTFRDFECIILDDASTDDSLSIIKKFVEQDSRFTYFQNSSNSGNTFLQWQKGIALAKFELIWIAESDDSCSQELLFKLIKCHLQHPNISLAYCQSMKMDGAGSFQNTWITQIPIEHRSKFQHDFTMNGPEFIENFLIFNNVIPNASAVLFKRSIYLACGGADERLQTNGDWLCWLKMLSFGDVAFLAFPYNHFRYHEASVIARLSISSASQFKESYDLTLRQIFNKWRNQNQLPLSKDMKKINTMYIRYDRGTKAIFEFRNRKIFPALFHLLALTFFPKPTFYYLRKALAKAEL